MPQGGCLWPQGLSSSTAIWSFGRAGGLRLRAVSWDSDAPSFWSYNQRKVYFWSLKTSIFKSQAGRYYVCVPFSRTLDQTMQFASGTSLSGFAHYSTRKSKNHNVNIWRTKIWSFSFFHAKRRTMRLRGWTWPRYVSTTWSDVQRAVYSWTVTHWA